MWMGRLARYIYAGWLSPPSGPAGREETMPDTIATSAVTVRYDVSRLTEHDIYLFKQGRHFRLYNKLGAHLVTADGEEGTLFAVWAPNAAAVSVIGDFNNWRPGVHPLRVREDGSGIWEGFVAGAGRGMRYKYRLRSREKGFEVSKGDPFALRWEQPPQTASVIWALDYEWNDGEWMARRADCNALTAPISIYELHPGSWRRVPEEDHRFLNYRELADQLGDYLHHMGYTHVECLPVMEHPFYGSWGYQSTGLFAPTARYGAPQDFMYFMDRLHQRGVGVILDWVPSHFPSDEHGLVYFDGTYLFEHADPKRGYHPEWNSYIYNYGRYEVRSILISSAMFWLDRYHADGLRVDAVASMLYLDYARRQGEWIPNKYGGNEDVDAVEFLRNLNEAVYRDFPDTQTIAEESTAWPMVSRPAHLGGLGFGMKWKMGWMHDTLSYFATDPVYRQYDHDKLTFSIWYAFSENYVLPLSHDEVVHGKGSLLGRMPGYDWQRMANLRALYGYMYGHPGKKLLFMGGEFGQWSEWRHDASLDWHLLEYAGHRGIQSWVRDLNHLYRSEPALHRRDFDADGFEWVDFHDTRFSIISFLRRSGDDPPVLVVCNFTPVLRQNYRIGVPAGGWWRELLNSDAADYGGSGVGNEGGVEAAPVAAHSHYHSLSLTLPPLAVLFLRPTG
jgi:1,4-alpha-glucan branching enzyme